MLISSRHFPTSTRKTRGVAIEYDAAKMSGKFLGGGGGSHLLKYTHERISGKWL